MGGRWKLNKVDLVHKLDLDTMPDLPQCHY
jgi:hypothetical protein